MRPPFEPSLLKKMVLTPFNQIVETYGTSNFHELEKLIRKDYTDKILCLPFGDRRIYFGQDWGLHLGTDYFLREGTSICAIAKSKVLIAGNFMSNPYDWGNLIITRTIDHLYVLYAHLEIEEPVTQKAGQMGWIEEGEVIGHVAKGWTNSSGNWPEHFHMQISKKYLTSGYAGSEEGLKDFVNPEELFPIG